MVQVFISYSHKDEVLKDELLKHLAALKRSKCISEWNDRKILAGQTLDSKIDENIKKANIILLLISSDFIASDYCYEKEMSLALEREKSNEVHVVPVIMRHCDWQSSPFSHLLACPKDGRPIMSFEDKDEGFADVAITLRKLVEDIAPTKKTIKAKNEYHVNNIYNQDGVSIGDVTGTVEENGDLIMFSEISNFPIPESNQIILWKNYKLKFIRAESYTGFYFGPDGAKKNVLLKAVYKII